jgi:hypothetical protein
MSLLARCSVAAMIGLALGLPRALAQDTPPEPKPPQVIADGLVLHQATVAEGRLATYLRVDLEKFDVRVLSALLPRKDDKAQAAPERAARGFFLNDYRTLHNAEAVLSGGYIASFSPPTPLGLIKSDWTVVNAPHESWLTDGYFCSEPGRAQIQRWIDLAAFRDCLQAGPILLLQGEPPKDLGRSRRPGSYKKLENSVQEQAFICTVMPNELILGVTDKINLPALVDFLSRKETGCTDAIRLTGEQTAGLVLSDKEFGHDDYLFPSVIAVMPRKP